VFPVLQGSADTLDRQCGKLYCLTIAYFLRNTPAKIIKIQPCIQELQIKMLGILFYETQSVSLPVDFGRHVVGKTLINVCHCDIV